MTRNLFAPLLLILLSCGPSEADIQKMIDERLNHSDTDSNEASSSSSGQQTSGTTTQSSTSKKCSNPYSGISEHGDAVLNKINDSYVYISKLKEL